MLPSCKPVLPLPALADHACRASGLWATRARPARRTAPVSVGRRHWQQPRQPARPPGHQGRLAMASRLPQSPGRAE